jgi:hypothetical protein
MKNLRSNRVVSICYWVSTFIIASAISVEAGEARAA